MLGSAERLVGGSEASVEVVVEYDEIFSAFEEGGVLVCTPRIVDVEW